MEKSPKVMGIALAAALACAACLAQSAKAQPAQPKKTPPAAQTQTQDAKAFAKLQAKAHRLMAKIVEAESADTPNQAKIDKLYADLREVRQKMWSLGPVAGRGAGPGWDRGRGWRRGGGSGWQRGGGAGWRRGGGPGWRRGRGGGGGRGWKRGGGGRGQGWGGGPGGRVRGPGPSAGPPGTRQGPYWVDEDGNGVCDHFEWYRGKPGSAKPKKKTTK